MKRLNEIVEKYYKTILVILLLMIYFKLSSIYAKIESIWDMTDNIQYAISRLPESLYTLEDIKNDTKFLQDLESYFDYYR